MRALPFLLLALCASAASATHILDSAAELQPWLVGLRREFHRFPELMFEEHNTSARIRAVLDELNITYQ